MNNQIEEDLRVALSARAAQLGDAPGAGILDHDYKPRGGVSRAALLSGGATIAVAVAATLLMLSLGTSTPRAFAGWSASPTTAAAGQVQNSEQVCRSRLPASTEAGQQAEASEWQAVLTDVRGPYTVSIYTAAEGKATFSCFTGRDPGVATLGGVFMPQPASAVPNGQVKIVSYGGNATPPDEGSERFSRLVGRVGTGVTAISVELSDGTQVSATVSNGWFLAWWPGTAHPTSTVTTTASGTATQAVGGEFG